MGDKWVLWQEGEGCTEELTSLRVGLGKQFDPEPEGRQLV